MSKKRAWFALPLLVPALAGVIYYAAPRAPRPPARAAQAQDHRKAATAATQAPSGLAADAARLKATLQYVDKEMQARQRPVVLQADQIVARVNGVALTGRDLLPYKEGRGEQAQSMSPQRYEMLLNRAIERELVTQTARAQRLELDAAQRQQLDRMREHARTVRGITDDERLKFEAREAESQLLLVELGQKAGLPSPFATQKDVERYYEGHPDEFEPLPADPAKRAAAWREIQTQIRQILSMETQAAHHKSLRAYVEQLRAGARITSSS